MGRVGLVLAISVCFVSGMNAWFICLCTNPHRSYYDSRKRVLVVPYFRTLVYLVAMIFNVRKSLHFDFVAISFRESLGQYNW